MKTKTIAGHSVSGIVVLVLMLVISVLTGDEEQTQKLLGIVFETAFQNTTTVTDDPAEDGEIATLVIANDGDTIYNSDKLELAGGLDFTGLKGDAIIMQKIDGVWVQIGKRLIDMEDFQ